MYRIHKLCQNESSNWFHIKGSSETQPRASSTIATIYQVRHKLSPYTSRGVHCTKHVQVYVSAQKGY